MELRQLAYLVAVADHGTFTAAARASHVAQPSLSQAVRTLEAELGVELFHRTGRVVVPTSAGDAVVARAREVLRAAAAVRSAAGAARGLLAGELQIASLPTLAVDPLTPLVGAFRRGFPAVTVHLASAEDLRAVVEALRRGRAELGLTELPVAGDDLVTLTLGHQELVVVTPPTPAPEVSEPAVRPEELAALPLIATPEGASLRHLVDEALAAVGLEARVVVVAATREAIVPLVLAGAGAAVLPRALAAAAAAQGAGVRPLAPALGREIGLVHRRAPLSPAAEAFLALAGARRDGAA
jgi:DNA-binding transcriptional LysR family regulator